MLVSGSVRWAMKKTHGTFWNWEGLGGKGTSIDQWKKGPPGCLGYLLGMKYYPSYDGDYNKPIIRIPFLNNQYFMESERVFFCGSGDNQTNSEHHVHFLNMAGKTEITSKTQWTCFWQLQLETLLFWWGRFGWFSLNFQDSVSKSGWSHILTYIHPRKLTWQWKITMFDKRYTFKWFVFYCHFSFLEGKWTCSFIFSFFASNIKFHSHKSIKSSSSLVKHVVIHLSNVKRTPGCFVYIRDESYPSYVGITINHHKDPY